MTKTKRSAAEKPERKPRQYIRLWRKIHTVAVLGVLLEFELLVKEESQNGK